MHADGRKLSKSLGDTGVSELRASGMQPDYIIGRAAHLAGLVERAGPLSVRDIGSLFAG
jgi:glutamyl/glutaminyl-tRNA synthetase